MEKGQIVHHFKLLEKIGTGNMGEVYRAEDLINQNRQTALKFIHENRINKISVSAFKTEFEVMSCLKHPNLLRVYDFGHYENGYFIAMEYAQGITGDEYRQRKDRQTLKDPLDILIDLCRALEFIHSRGVLHRDIKPDNVIIQGDVVKLMDFGLADLESSDYKAKGTLNYIAPEVITKKIGPLVDLFALGITFFEFFTGEYFYSDLQTGDITMMLSDPDLFYSYKQERLKILSDQKVAYVVGKMIEFKKNERLQSFPEVIDEINRSIGKEYEIETPHTREAYVLGGSFVGREHELSLIKNKVNEKFDKAILIYGQPGIGKSRLISEIKRYNLIHDNIFLEGTCHEHLISMFTPFQSLVCEALYDVDEAVLKTYGGALKKLFPGHRKLLTIEADKISNSAEKERDGLIHAISGFLHDYVEDIPSSCILYIDDVQWCDDASLEVLEYLIGASYKKNRLSIILTSREEGLTTHEFLNNEQFVFKQKLTPFNEKHVSSFIYAVFGKNRISTAIQTMIPKIKQKVGGNPFYLQEIVRSLVNSGIFCRDQLLWTLSRPIEAIVLPNSLEEYILKRFEWLNLTPAEMKILRIIALINREISYIELNRIIPVKYGLLLELEEQEILLKDVKSGGSLFTIYHDLMRDTLVESLDEPEILYDFVASRLEEIHKGELAFHYDELAYLYRNSHNTEKKIEYFALAGDRAIARFDNRKAYDHLEALRNLLPIDSEQYVNTLLKMGELCRIFTEIDKGITILEKAKDICEKQKYTYQFAESNLILGRILMFDIKFEKALNYFQLAAKYFEELGDELKYALTLNYLGANHNQLYNFNEALAYHKKSLEIAKRLEIPDIIARNIGNMGFLYMNIGKYDLAIECNLQAIEIMTKVGDKGTLAIGYGLLGTAYNNNYDYKNAIKSFDKSIEISELLNYNYVLCDYLTTKAEVLIKMNRLQEAYQCMTRALKLVDEMKIDEKGFEISLLQAKYSNAIGNKEDSAKYLDRALSYSDKPHFEGEVYYWYWKILGDTLYRDKAMAIFKRIYEKSPVARFKEFMIDMEGCP